MQMPFQIGSALFSFDSANLLSIFLWALTDSVDLEKSAQSAKKVAVSKTIFLRLAFNLPSHLLNTVHLSVKPCNSSLQLTSFCLPFINSGKAFAN